MNRSSGIQRILFHLNLNGQVQFNLQCHFKKCVDNVRNRSCSIIPLRGFSVLSVSFNVLI